MTYASFSYHCICRFHILHLILQFHFRPGVAADSSSSEIFRRDSAELWIDACVVALFCLYMNELDTGLQ